MNVPGAYGSTRNSECNTYSLEKDAGIGCPKAVSANRYSVHCSTQTSTSSDDGEGWTTVKRKDHYRPNKLSLNEATECSNSNSNMSISSKGNVFAEPGSMYISNLASFLTV